MKTAKPLPYPTNPQTIGDHLVRRRHELGLHQKDAAALLRVNQWTLIGWEKDRKDPPIRFWPRVIKFLGYDPHGELRTLGERLLAARRRLGVTQEEAAKMVSVARPPETYGERSGRLFFFRVGGSAHMPILS